MSSGHSPVDGGVQGLVGLTVAAAVESMASGLAGRCQDGRDAAQAGERGFGGEPFRIVADRKNQCCSGIRSKNEYTHSRGRDMRE